MHVYLIRHGQKQTIAGNPALTELGWRQAAATGEYCASLSIQGIWASPLLRTQQTAQVVAQKLQLSITTDARLYERANYEGNMPFDAFLGYWRAASQERAYQPPVGVSSYKAGEQVTELITEIASMQQFETVLLVSSGGIITDYLRNTVSDAFLLEHHYHTIERLYDTEVPECSITHIVTGGGASEIVTLCSTEHLKNLEQ